MDECAQHDTAREPGTQERSGSSIATHRRAERVRSYVYHPRPEARM